MPSSHRLSIYQHLSPAGRADEIVAALLADDRVMSLHGLVTEQSDIAFLGPADDGNRFAQRIFATFARVAALRTHHHQPSAFEQLADQADEESDQRAEHDNRDRAAERLRKGRGQALVEESPERAARQSPERSIAPARVGARCPSDPKPDQDSQYRPSEDPPVESAEDVKGELADQQPDRAAESPDDSSAANPARRLTPLADTHRLDASQKGANEEADQRAEQQVARVNEADAQERLCRAPCPKSAEPAGSRVEQQFFPGQVACHKKLTPSMARPAPGFKRRSGRKDF